MAKKSTPLGGYKSKSDKLVPFPALIDGQIWDVVEGKDIPHVSRNSDPDRPSRMAVPMGDTIKDRKIRLHESAHVKWSVFKDSEGNILPLEEMELPSEIDGLTMNAAEDARIIKKLNDLHPEYREINTSQEGLMLDAFARHERAIRQNQMSALDAAKLYTSVKGYADEKVFGQALRNNGMSWVTEWVDALYDKNIGSKDDPEIMDAVNLAQALSVEIPEEEKRQQDEQEKQEQEEKEFQEELEEADIPHRGEVEDKFQRGDLWGDMEIVKAPLNEKLSAKLLGKKHVASDTGIVPRYSHRGITDGRVFTRKKVRQNASGTVLVDLSGSMSLGSEQISEILRRWPAVIVAAYSSAERDKTKGYLRILAQKGRMASPDNYYSGVGWFAGKDNVIDGPALEWLSKQKSPRIWISDGLVTGRNASRSNPLLLDAARIVKKGNIQRIPNVRELLSS